MYTRRSKMTACHDIHLRGCSNFSQNRKLIITLPNQTEYLCEICSCFLSDFEENKLTDDSSKKTIFYNQPHYSFSVEASYYF